MSNRRHRANFLRSITCAHINGEDALSVRTPLVTVSVRRGLTGAITISVQPHGDDVGLSFRAAGDAVLVTAGPKETT